MSRLFVLLLGVASLLSLIAPAVARPEIHAHVGELLLTLRFHHLHLRVPDPARSMNALAAKVQGTRVILQGFGVGVRSGDQYVLFDRTDDDPGVQGPGAAEKYRRAAAWLKARGSTVEPQDLQGSAFAAFETADAVDHVAFSTSDLAGAVNALSAAGAAPVRRTGDAALFSIGTGDIVEILGDTDGPDAFWCPMHLDVRSAAAGKCSICSMELVPIPPLHLGAYRLDVEPVVSRARGIRGDRVAGLRLRVRDPDGKGVTSFATVHERAFHLFIIGGSLDYFEHVHPEAVGEPGRFDLEHELPPGEYMLFADFLPYGGTTQLLQRAIVTPGYGGRVFPETPRLSEGPAEAVVDGVRVRIDADLAAGKRGCLRFELSDAQSMAPITDLEPFLGAPAHLLIVKPDLTEAFHAHPEETAIGGPSVSFEPLMPSPGLYKLWVQFQRKGKVSTASFVVAVR